MASRPSQEDARAADRPAQRGGRARGGADEPLGGGGRDAAPGGATPIADEEPLQSSCQGLGPAGEGLGPTGQGVAPEGDGEILSGAVESSPPEWAWREAAPQS